MQQQTIFQELLNAQLKRKQTYQASLCLLDAVELLQQHRGISLAIQAGNPFFQQRLSQKQRELYAILNKMEEHAALSPFRNAIQRDIRDLILRLDLKDPYNNFVLHCHVLQEMILRSDHLFQKQCPEQDNIHKVAFFTQALNLAEWLAQSRGISVFLSSSNKMDAAFQSTFQSRLSFVVSEARKIHTQLLTLMRDDRFSKKLKDTLLQSQCHDTLNQFLSEAEQLISIPDTERQTPRKLPDNPSDYYYTMASDVLHTLFHSLRKELKRSNDALAPELSKLLLVG